MTDNKKYYFPTGGLPSQRDIMTQRAVFTEAYAVIQKVLCETLLQVFYRIGLKHELGFWRGRLVGFLRHSRNI